MSIADDILNKATDYFSYDEQLADEEIPVMLVGFAIEKFKQRRNYPPHFTEEQIENDMKNHMMVLAMAVVDLFAKYGTEGETKHSEKNIQRIYQNAYISEAVFKDVCPYVGCIR